MLALKLGISLPSLSTTWSPIDESSLEAWYQWRTGLTYTGGLAPQVSKWEDRSTNGFDMVQTTDSEQPNLDTTTYELTFVAEDDNNLQTAGTDQITLTGDFSIGIRCYPTDFNNVIIADNTSSNEFFKFTSGTNLRVRIGGSTANIELDSGSFGDMYVLITRASNVLTLYHNGVRQTGSTPTLSGTALIDAIGVRATDLNAYSGDIKEIQIYSSTSSTLTAAINARLATL